MKGKSMDLLNGAAKVIVCATAGALVAEGVCICGNALIKDANMAKDIVSGTKQQPAKKKFTLRKGGK